MANKKYVYHFEEALRIRQRTSRGKGAGLAEMTHIGIPIPEGFTVSTETCTLYYASKKSLPDYVVEEVYNAIAALEKENWQKLWWQTKTHY